MNVEPDTMDNFYKNNITPVGTNISAQARIVINNVLNFLTEMKEDPEKLRSISFARPRDLTASICGVSVRTVDTIKKECKNGVPVSPRENVCQPSPVTDIDDFHKSVIKQIVSSFNVNKVFPTINKVLNKAKERIDGFKCSVSSMRKILIELGYKYTVASDGRTKLMERKDIVCKRQHFLRKLKSLKDSKDTCPGIYLDGTWVNQNDCRKYVWAGKEGQGATKTEIGKGNRLVGMFLYCFFSN